MDRESKEIKSYVKEHYGARARQRQSCAPSCGGRGLYDPEELKGVPEGAAGFSLGCGHPAALAQLKEGEVVLDLGSGGGLDCLLAAKQVGTTGKVIGLDMTSEMVALARENAAKMDTQTVEFRLGEMEHMPLDSSSVDVIISNCVINLSPDKDAVFREAYRVLKPGGRISVSDMVLVGELPPEIREDLQSWASCLAGALPIEVYLEKLRRAGFSHIRSQQQGTGLASLPVVSLWVSALKPG